MTVKKLDAVRGQVEILQWCAARRAEIKELEDSAKAAVQDALGGADTGMLDDEIVVTWAHSKRRILNQKALREHHPELAESFTEATEVRTFKVVDK